MIHIFQPFKNKKDGVPGENKRIVAYAYSEEDKKLINLDVHAHASIGNSLLYHIYHLLQNYFYAKEMIDTIVVEGTNEVKA